MGVVSGIVMSFQFGTNWSNFAQATANFIGPMLSYEVVTAFFLEAAFLGVLLFGRDKVPAGVHLFAAVMVALGTFVFGRDVFSYATTWGGTVRNAVKSEVPLEFEIERARTEVENLVPDIRDMMHVIASAQVDIDHKAKHVERKSATLDSKKKAILALRSDLDSGRTEFVYAKHSYSAGDVRKDLEKRFKLYKVAENSLESDTQILTAWQRTMRANQDKLDSMLTAKQHELLTFIHQRLEEGGISPSFEEMKEALDLKSKSGVHRCKYA